MIRSMCSSGKGTLCQKLVDTRDDWIHLGVGDAIRRVVEGMSEKVGCGFVNSCKMATELGLAWDRISMFDSVQGMGAVFGFLFGD